MSLFWKYAKERDNLDVLELEDGFILYQKQSDGRHWYITDFYVVPEKRNQGIGQLLFAMLCQDALDAGAVSIGGTVRKDLPYAAENLKKFLEVGQLMVIHENELDIELYKEL